MPFSPDLFLQELRAPHFGRAVRFLEETTSTIDAAWEWLREGGPDRGAVIAARQTLGRGRAGRAWASPEGGLWMSVAVRPHLPASRAGRLGVAMALAACEAVRITTGGEAGVEWPNDVILNGRKLGGVLGEAEVEGGAVVRVVLSVGLNVNLRLTDLPEEVRDIATTLLEATGRQHALEPIAARTLEALEHLWQSVLTDGRRLVEAWRDRDALLGQEVTVEMGAETVRGENRGIDADGALLLAAGELQRLTVGEIGRIRAVQ
jgi:BirA family biotin operon repressor/biotin-[acetyl-CoA-carboxylase] ligase